MKQRTLAMMTGFRRRGCFGRTQYRAAEWTALVSHAVLRGAILSVHGRGCEAPSNTASRVRFALTQVVLGIDCARSARTHPFLSCGGSTEPAPRLAKPSRRRQDEIHNIDMRCRDHLIYCGTAGSNGRAAHAIQAH